MDAHRRGEAALAADLYDRFLRLQPGHAQALRLRGVLARELGDSILSLDLLQKARQLAPQDPEPRSEIALTCLAIGDYDRAERELRETLEIDAYPLRALANLGALLQYRGHLQEALEMYRRVLRQTPDDLEVVCNLVSTLADAGREAEALQTIDARLMDYPDHPLLLAAQGAVLTGLGRYDEASQVLTEATARNPADDMALINLAMSQRERGAVADARESLRRALRANAQNARAVADLVNLSAADGDLPAALALAEDFLAQHPGERLTLAAYVLALRDAGRDDAARELVDHDKMIRVTEPLPPDRVGPSDKFLQALKRLILTDRSLLNGPASKATRGGSQTGELRLSSDVVLMAWRDMINAEVAAAIDALREAGLEDHPVMAYAAAHWDLRAWATVLEPGGRQEPHQHPLGFLSGVYYVDLPAAMSGETANSGWLEFGQPPTRLRHATAPPIRLLEPRPGRLVIFPSYFHHRTLPFEAAGQRISLAFDVMPRP